MAWLHDVQRLTAAAPRGDTATEIGRLLHEELLGNQWLHSGVTANVHNPGVRMLGEVVGLYCAVVDRFDLLGIDA